MVLGERCTDIAVDLRGFSVTWRPDDMAELHGRFPEFGPLARALYRAEAELLLADANAMADGSFDGRSADERRSAAFTLLINRFVDTSKIMTTEKATGHDPRGHTASDQKRRTA